MTELLDAVGLFIEKVGPLAGIIVLLALLFRAPFAGLLSSRAKRSDVEAEDERVKAESVATLNHTTRTLIEAIPAISTSLRETAASQKMTAEAQKMGAEAQHAQVLTMNQMLFTLKEIMTNASTSGAAIAAHMETNTAAQTVAQVTASTASATITAAQTELLIAIATFTDQLRILTEQIKSSGDVDDTLRAAILAQMTQINAFLTRSEAKEEKEEKAKQDEKPNEPKTTQTTIELKGEVVGVLNTADLSGDKPSGGTDK